MKHNKKENGIENDEKLLEEIAPIGNLKHYDDCSRTGTGYEACIHIYDYPAILEDYWLTNLCGFQNTITTISIETMDQLEVKKNLNKAIEEQGSRKRFAKDYNAYYDAESREQEMKRLFDEISALGEVMKSISIRIFVASKTRTGLEESVAKIIKSLEANSYRAAVFINESESEW